MSMSPFVKLSSIVNLYNDFIQIENTRVVQENRVHLEYFKQRYVSGLNVLGIDRNVILLLHGVNNLSIYRNMNFVGKNIERQV